MIERKYSDEETWNRIRRAVEKVKDRMRRVSQALNVADIPYAIIGGNAVQYWVAQVDESVVRSTRDVDIIINRSDLESVTRVLAESGFIYRHAKGITMFLDGPDAKARDAVHVLFAGEHVRPDSLAPVPQIQPFESMETGVRTLPLEQLVTMKLTSYRLKDRVHLLDMISIGLIDETWPPRFSAGLRDRLQQLIDDPDG